MLDCVRRGCPTDETLCTPKQRVIQVSVSDKFSELQESGQTPVCLFLTRKACDDFNKCMNLCVLTRWIKLYPHASGIKKPLNKLNSDCNMTAGLEAKLSLAVGARVMLRCNIDTKAGLVNGAIGSVVSIAVNCVTVQFDHMSQPYNVEMVMVSPTCLNEVNCLRETFSHCMIFH